MFGAKKGAPKAPVTGPGGYGADNAAKAVQKDWEQRDFTQTLQLGLSQLTLFLNQFGAPPRQLGTRARESLSPPVPVRIR